MKWSAEDYTHDPWTEIAISNLRQKAIAIMTPALNSTTDKKLRKYISSSILDFIQSEADALVYLKSNIKEASEIKPELLHKQLNDINRANLESKQDDSHFAYLLARSKQAQQTQEHLNNSRQQACQNWPSSKNTYCREDNGN